MTKVPRLAAALSVALLAALPLAAYAAVSSQVTVSLSVTSSSTPTSTPTSTAPAPGGGGAPLPITPLVVSDVSISYLSPNEVVVTWRTNLPATTEISYGRTLQYEEATLAESDSLVSWHEVTLAGLQPGALYHAQIRGAAANGQRVATSDFVFSTEEEADRTPPANVAGLSVSPGDGQLTLTWQNPADRDFAGVAVVRRTGGYPADVDDGTVVARTAATSFTDRGLDNGTRYYYALFTYDSAPNYSSGALGSGVPAAAPEAGQPVPPVQEPVIPPSYVPVAPGQELPQSAAQVAVYQGTVILQPGATGTVSILGGEPFTVVLPSFLLARQPERVLVEVSADGGVQWYLLRIEAGQTAYRATLPPLPQGTYRVQLHVLYGNQTRDTLTRYVSVLPRGTVVAEGSQPLAEAVVVLWERRGNVWQLWQPVENVRNPVVTGEDGTFGFMVDGAGRYRVQVLMGGFEPWDEEVEPRGGVINPVVTLSRASRAGGVAGAATDYVLVGLVLAVAALVIQLVRRR